MRFAEGECVIEISTGTRMTVLKYVMLLASPTSSFSRKGNKPTTPEQGYLCTYVDKLGMEKTEEFRQSQLRSCEE
jgi:hypothetical protein